ncbi:MAG: amino acid adenylation domain-containing protein, partial [Deltaproteobacteria bacterium]|nr:amino acid adenylation domain-containing protein [Deltaproteobacteria bacterium]
LVAICVERSAEMVVSLLAILKAGGAYVPVDPKYPQARIAHILADSRASIAVTTRALAPLCAGIEAKALVTLDTLAKDIGKEATSPLATRVDPKQLAYIIYTSGSTGGAKGVAIEHRNAVTLLHWAREEFSDEELSGVLAATSICFDLSVFELFVPLSWGGTVIVAENALALGQLPARTKVKLVNTVPSAMTQLEATGAIPESVCAINLAGEALSDQLVQKLYGHAHIRKVRDLYGPSEDTTYSTAALRKKGSDSVVTIGRPIANTAVYLLSPEFELVPQGANGEICIGGHGLARGYLHRPELTAEKFIEHPVYGRLYRTGDLGRWLASGELQYLGRRDNQVKVRGFRIELGEIEAALSKRVKEAVVVVHGEGSSKQLVGYYVGDATPQALKDALKQALPEYMVPAILMPLEALPLTPNGKIDRKALPAPEAKSESEYIAPRNAAEELVAGAYAQVLGLKQPVGAHDDFFALGGHSLLATQLVSRFTKIFGKTVPLKTVFDAPRVSELTLCVEAAERTSSPALVARPRPERLPLSYAQQRLFFLHQFAPGSVAYNITEAIRVHGPLDVEAFERALNGVIARHESLRTTFRLTEGSAEQVVHEELPVAIEHLDGAYQEKAFDFLRGPLVRCAVRRVGQKAGPDEHEVYLSMHHIVSDDWSAGVFWRELSALYNSESLPPLSVQYADYTLWQREHVKLDAQEAYWKQKFSGAPAALELPTDRPRPAAMSHRGAVHTFTIEKVGELNALSRTEGVTLYMTLLAAFDVLLARYSGQDDIVVGTPIANRQYEATEPLIGFFVNTLCMRADVSGNPSFRALLKNVKETALEAYAHQDLPFEKLVEALNPERSTARSPVFQVIFVLQNAPAGAGEFSPGLTFEALTGQAVQAKFDLTVQLWEKQGRLEGTIEYATDLFDRETIERMVGHYQQLLRAIAQNPDKKISALELLGEAERKQLAVVAERDYRSDQSVHAMFAAQAKKTPEAVAVVFEGQTLSYRELDERSSQLANHLQKRGVGPETLVPICVERSAEMVVGLLGILKAGGAYVPLDPSYPRDRLEYMLADSGAKLLVTSGNAADGFVAETVVRMEEIGNESTTAPRVELSADAPAYVIYTSGSTGRPKGVIVTHRNVARLFLATEQWYHFSSQDVWTLFHSYAFDFSVWEMWGALLYGGRLVVVPYVVSRSPADFFALLCREGVTVLNQTPSAFRQLIEVAKGSTALRLVIFGGEALDLRTLRPWFERYGDQKPELVNMYGITETTVHVTYRPIRLADVEQNLGSVIGRGIDDLAVYVLDKHGQPQPVGIVGELYVGGAGLARGYLNRPELTAERFATHPTYGRLYKTGDLARRLRNGDLEYLGRNDNQVKIRGFRIELGEIEAALQKQIKEAVVVVHGEGTNKQLVGYYVGEVTPQALRDALKQQLPEYMVPTILMRLPALPLTPNGKVDRKALPAPEATSGGEAPRTDLEKRIAAVWCKVLKRESVGVSVSFFDVGGHSLLLLALHGELEALLEKKISVVSLFQNTTVEAQSAFFSGSKSDEQATPRRFGPKKTSSRQIAIVGMALRVPGAKTLDEFWKNLVEGKVPLTRLDDATLRAAGASEAVLRDERLIRTFGGVDGLDKFDAALFGMSPSEAAITDPQHRLLLQCTWEALEDAGYVDERRAGRVGVFASAAMSSYWLQRRQLPKFGGVAALGGNGSEFVASKLAFRFNLTGSAVSVQTACSSGLVTVHFGCEALLEEHCDVAIAAAASLRVEPAGELYEPEGILSPDGLCRAFDAKANGTGSSSGVAVVVLKRLEDALRDDDPIHAVIDACATNNDGHRKDGFFAPSPDGQAEVISAAQQMAGVKADDIGYVEAHGTGTLLGDPIEIAGLSKAFRASTQQTQFCPIGSVKSNIGHTDTAAGLVSLIKTALTLKHGEIPPSVNFSSPNPLIDFANSPFFVNDRLRPWPASTKRRIAGVSSFGLGGTNAHAILEEAPARAPAKLAIRAPQVFPVSAMSQASLAESAARLADHLAAHPDEALADVAYTLQVGRRALPLRVAVVASTAAEAAAQLREQAKTVALKSDQRHVVFMFPGRGVHRVGMFGRLYETEKEFRAVVDECAKLLRPLLGVDLREVLYAAADKREWAEKQGYVLEHVGVFVVEYALARLWMSWGIQPNAVIGHSLGEFAAACLAGVFTLPDALKVVTLRARIHDAQPAGVMVAVLAAPEQVESLLTPGVAVAAINARDRCTVAGSPEAVAAFEARLAKEKVEFQRVHLAGAPHTPLMDGALAPLREVLASVKLQAPQIELRSCYAAERADFTSAEYWVQHLRQTVRFSAMVDAVAQRGANVFIEVGPGHTLSRLVTRHIGPSSPCVIVTSQESDEIEDQAALLGALGKVWCAGIEPNWDALHGEKRRRVNLPTYAFEQRRCWVEREPDRERSRVDRPVDEWINVPLWQPASPLDAATQAVGEWIVFCDEDGPGREVASRLRAAGHETILVRPGAECAARDDGSMTIDPAREEHYDALIEKLGKRGQALGNVLHLWALPPAAQVRDGLQQRCLDSLFFLGRALDRNEIESASLFIVASEIFSVRHDEHLVPEKALVLGPARVMSQEYGHVSCRLIDIGASDVAASDVDAIVEEVTRGDALAVVARRGTRRWVQSYAPVRMRGEESGRTVFREGGCCLITGGLGRIGQVFAEHLAQRFKAKLVLVGRHARPEIVARLAELGGEAMVVAADVGKLGDMQAAVAQARARFGAIHGVIHAAGVVPDKAIFELTKQELDAVVAAKVAGTRVLEQIFREDALDFLLLCSSTSSILGGVKFMPYAAANAFLDAFASEQEVLCPRRKTIAVNWNGWRFEGDAADGERTLYDDLISPAEGVLLLTRALRLGEPRVVMSTQDFNALVDRVAKMASSDALALVANADEPAQATGLGDEMQTKLAALWREVLEVDKVEPTDNFLALGGDSLAALRLVARLRDRFGIVITMRRLMAFPTLAEMAALLEGSQDRAVLPALVRQKRPARLPLSYAQQRMYFLYRLDPESLAYNQTFATKMRGPLDLVRFETALNGVIARHESLRTTFREIDGVAEQVVHDAMSIALERSSEAYVDRPFDLEKDPPLRCHVRRLRDDEHDVRIVMHHIATDLVSFTTLWRDLASLYAGKVLPALPIQYADYALWQREHVRLDAQEAYWKKKLTGAPAALELPTDQPRPAVMSHRGAVHTFTIEKSGALGALHGLSQAEGATLYMTLLAAFDVLLARYSGQDDIVVASPIANRQYEATEQLIGFFVNTLCMRADLSGNPSFRAFLRKVKETALEAYAHQDLPFEKLVEALNPERSTARTPVFQVMFTLQNESDGRREFSPGLTLEELGGREVQAKFDLTLLLSENAGRLEGEIEYATDLFEPETIERMVEHFQKMLSAIAKNPDEKINALEMLGDAERQRLIVEWNRTRKDDGNAGPAELLTEQAARTPDATALVFGDVRMSYRELEARSSRLASYLRSLDVTTGSVVAVCLQRSLDMVVALLGVAKAGAAYLPLDPSYPQDRIQYILSDSGARIALASTDTAMLVDGSRARCVRLDQAWPDIDKHGAQPFAHGASGADLAYVIYTSGSTGKPKGVEVLRRGLASFIASMRNELGMVRDDVLLAVTTISFDIAGLELYVPLSVGATIVLADQATVRDGPALLALMEAEKVTVMQATPTTWQMLIEAGWRTHSERRMVVMCGGEALPRALAQALVQRSTAAWNMYGPTETTIWSTMDRLDTGPVTLGRPIANTELYVLDKELTPVPIGVIGELYIGGIGVARGYLNRAELTAERFVANPFGEGRLYKTGDLVRYRSDGRVEFRGRADTQVKVRGFRIELGEIEAALQKQVKEAAVVVHGDGSKKQLVGYYVGEATPQALRDALKQQLPEYMVPAILMPLPALPLTPNGKVDRKALPAPEAKSESEYVAPRNAMEESLMATWAKVLRRERVGVRDNFFALGGDSIMTIQVVAEASRRGVRLSVKQMFSHQTIEALATVAEAVEAAPTAATAQAVTGVVALTPIQSWFFARKLAHPEYFNQHTLFVPKRQVGDAEFRDAVKTLVERHDALRLRFGSAGQEVGGTYDAARIERGELSEVGRKLAAGFSLERGQLFVAALVTDATGKQTILMIAHHLVVDLVSWRFLHEELERLLSGQALDAAPYPFSRWAEDLAKAPVTDADREFWQKQRPSLALPIERHGTNDEQSAETVELTLTEATTRTLQREVVAKVRGRLEDVLLTALGQALCQWASGSAVRVDLEGHGRPEGGEVEQTVGWFTTIMPITVERERDPMVALKATKEMLRRVAAHELAYMLLRQRDEAPYAASEVLFNYLGRIDFDTLNIPDTHPDNDRGHALHVSAVLRGEALTLVVDYSLEQFDRPTIENLIARYSACLDELAAALKASGAGATPSDFAAVELDQAAIDEFMRQS